MVKKLQYRPEIDGLRAIAVVSVVLFHAGFGFVSGGYVGVDIFFVISGFLITNIIVSEIEGEGFSIVKFYERRARRILPALFFVLISCLPFAWLYLDPFALKEFAQSLVAASLFSSNIYFFLKTGYFNVAADLKPLLHTWSLAVEEQFYIIFPLILMVFGRFGRTALMAIVALLFIVSLAVAEWASNATPTAAFYLLHTRAWELMIGALAAFYLKNPRNLPASVNQAASFLGVAMVILSVAAFDSDTPFPGLYALVPTVGTVLIILCAVNGTLANKLLASRPFVAIGLLSYSIYLWHQPVFAFYRIIFLEELDLVAMAYCLPLVMALSYISYRWVEQPFRHKPKQMGKRIAFGAACIAGLIGFTAIGALGHVRMGFPERSPQFMRLAQNYGLSADCSGADLDNPKCISGKNPRILLWGDSYAMHLAAAVNKLDDREMQQLTLSGCPPLLGFGDAKRKSLTPCSDYNDRVFAYLRQIDDREAKTVVMASGQNMARPDSAALLFDTLSKVRALGYRVVLVSPTPRHRNTSPCIQRTMRNKQSLRQCDFTLATTENAMVFPALAKIAARAGVGYINLSGMFCTDGQCRVETDDGTLLYRDIGHMAVESRPVLIRFLTDQGLAEAPPTVATSASAGLKTAR